MTFPSPEDTTPEEALNACFKRTSDLLTSLQRLRLARGNMNRNEFRDEEQELVNQISDSVEEYRRLSEQLHSESD